jgi:hypothetical protein
MALSVKHNTLTTELGGGLVGATQWDEGHELTAAVGKLIGTPSASTTVGEITPSTGLLLSGSTLSVNGLNIPTTDPGVKGAIWSDDGTLKVSLWWLPEGALAYADFVNGRYYAGGGLVTVDDVIVEDAAVWAAWDKNTQLTSEGYDGGPILTGDFRDAALDNATLDVHFIDPPAWTLDVGIDLNNLNIGNIEGATTESVPFTSSIGIHKVALTFDDTHGAVSADGAAVTTVAQVAEWSARNNAVIGTTNSSTRVRSITIYPAVADAALPALSAL